MYYVNDKSFKERCDAREYSFQLCHQFQSANKYWKTITIKSTSDSMLDSYAVYDIINKEYVFEAIIIVD